MSLQDATVQDGEGHRSCLMLVFERNEVKARFSDMDSANKLHSIILASACVRMCVRCVSVDGAIPLADRDGCLGQARQRQAQFQQGSSSSSLQQFHSLSTAAARRESGRGAHLVQATPSYRWLDHLFVTLQLRPREVYQPLETQGGGLEVVQSVCHRVAVCPALGCLVPRRVC